MGPARRSSARIERPPGLISRRVAATACGLQFSRDPRRHGPEVHRVHSRRDWTLPARQPQHQREPGHVWRHRPAHPARPRVQGDHEPENQRHASAAAPPAASFPTAGKKPVANCSIPHRAARNAGLPVVSRSCFRRDKASRFPRVSRLPATVCDRDHRPRSGPTLIVRRRHEGCPLSGVRAVPVLASATIIPRLSSL